MTVRIDTVRIGIVNTYLVRDRGAILVDPGPPVQAAAVLRALGRILDELGDIRLIIATHGHFDHVGAAAAVRAATGAAVAVHHDDAHCLRDGAVEMPGGVTRWGRLMRVVAAPLVARFIQIPTLEPDLLVSDDGLDLEPYGVAGRVVHTPGHTPGSLSVLLNGGDCLVGDLAMNGRPFTLRPRFGIFAHQPERVPDSWRRLRALGVRTVYPAHGRPFPASALAP